VPFLSTGVGEVGKALAETKAVRDMLSAKIKTYREEMRAERRLQQQEQQQRQQQQQGISNSEAAEWEQLLESVQGLAPQTRADYAKSFASARMTVKRLAEVEPQYLAMFRQDANIPAVDFAEIHKQAVQQQRAAPAGTSSPPGDGS